MGRPRLYADNAERQAAYRDRNAVVDARFPAKTVETLDKFARAWDMPRTEVINSMVQFALLNRNWEVMGHFGNLLPLHKEGS